LREKTPDITSDFGASFAFEHIVSGIPALFHFATGCDKCRPTRLRLIAVTTNIRIELRLDIAPPIRSILAVQRSPAAAT
jgi:hypothetical protein